MNISSNKLNSNQLSFQGKTPKIFTVQSEAILKEIKRLGNLSTPAHRFFLGATALATQPIIDLNNKNVDEETRIVSTARTMAKIIAGTVVGVAVRAGCIETMKFFTDPKAGSSAKKWKTALFPNHLDKNTLNMLKKSEDALGKHRKALGSIIALFAMLITNFAIDLPLTKYLTNKFVKKFKNAENIPGVKGGKT